MKNTTNTGKKGQYHYVTAEKKRRLIKTLIYFAFPIAILISSLLILKSRETLVMVLAVLLCLPAGKQLVSFIMIMMFKSMDVNNYKEIEQHKGSLTMVYENILTNYEKNTFVDAIAICGNQVVGYTSSAKADTKYAEEHTQKILRHNGYKVTVKILKDYNRFLERLDSMNEHEESLRSDIPFTPDERYPDCSREDMIRHTILAISL